MVVATQNPVEMQGTYPLPEAPGFRSWWADESPEFAG